MRCFLVQCFRKTQDQFAAELRTLDRLWNAQSFSDRCLQPAVRHSFKVGERFARCVANRNAAWKFDDLRPEGSVGLRNNYTTIGSLQILSRVHGHLCSYLSSSSP